MVTKTTMTPPEMVDIPTVIKTKSSCLVIFPRYGRINKGASTWPKIIFAVELNPIGPPTFSGFLNRVEIALMIMGKIFQCQKIADKAETTIINIKPEKIKILATPGSMTSNGFGAPSAK